MDYDFPEIEEYFMYNPKTGYPNCKPNVLVMVEVKELSFKGFNHLLHIWTCR
jgi:hypothetical protein